MDAPPPLLTFAIAAWGAALATLIAIRDTWRNRFRVDATLSYRSDPTLGNEILITNLSDKPVTLVYWEILFLNRRCPRREEVRQSISPEGELLSRVLPPGDTCRLDFTGFYHFDLTPQLIYIKLHFVGRHRKLLRLYGPRERRR